MVAGGAEGAGVFIAGCAAGIGAADLGGAVGVIVIVVFAPPCAEASGGRPSAGDWLTFAGGAVAGAGA